MGCTFPRGGSAIVTADAIRGDTNMVEGGWQPTVSSVTKTAHLSGLNVITTFARRCCAVMASAAATKHLSVVYLGRGLPAILRMTGATVVGGVNVMSVLNAGANTAAWGMAGGAITACPFE